MTRPLYIVGRNAGDRGHFISSLLLQLHRSNDQPIEYNGLGNAHDYVFRYYWEHTNFFAVRAEYEYNIQHNYLEFTSESDDPLIVMYPAWRHDSVDYANRMKTYSNIKYIHISFLPNEIEELLANDFYKATAPDSTQYPELGTEYLSIYQTVATQDPKCRANIEQLIDLNEYEVQALIHHLAADHRQNTYSLVTEKCLASIPESVTIHTVAFRDILNDKEKVLTTLEEVTGCKRTPAIEQSYDNYLEKQKAFYTENLGWL